MSGQPFVPLVLTSQKAVGTLLSSYTAAKSILNPTELYTLPANYLAQGSKLRIKALIGLGNIVTTPGTFVLQVMMGSIVVFTTGNIQLNATAHADLPLAFEATLRLDSAGSGTAAKFLGQATMIGIQPTLTAGQTDAANTSGAFVGPVTQPAVGTGFDSTIANVLDLWGGFSISNSGNYFLIYDYSVEQLQ